MELSACPSVPREYTLFTERWVVFEAKVRQLPFHSELTLVERQLLVSCS